MVESSTLSFDLRGQGGGSARADGAFRRLVAGTAVGCAIAAVALLAVLPPSEKASPRALFTYGVLFFFAAASAWIFLSSLRGSPDTAEIDGEGVRLFRAGRPLRVLRWEDTGFSLELINLSGDSRANALPRVPRFSLRAAHRKGTIWPLSQECFDALLRAASEKGLSVARGTAADYHFPDGETFQIGPRRP